MGVAPSTRRANYPSGTYGNQISVQVQPMQSMQLMQSVQSMQSFPLPLLPQQPPMYTVGTGVMVNTLQMRVSSTPLGYEQQVINQQILQTQQRAYINKKLRESLPVSFVILHAIAMILIGCIAIGLETASMLIQNTPFFFGTGIWTGLVAISLGKLSFVLICKREYCLYITSIIANLFGMFAMIIGMTILQIGNLVDFNCPICGSLYAVMLGMGLVAFTICFIYLCLLRLRVQHGSSNNYRQNYNALIAQQQQIQPQLQPQVVTQPYVSPFQKGNVPWETTPIQTQELHPETLPPDYSCINMGYTQYPPENTLSPVSQ